jgi:NAD(P)-dependent dehydrogenase (short-subunit alcohol dehydrogenase family)
MTQAVFDFHGRTAVVTGGSGALGGAIARGLAAAGARVALVANRRLQEAEAAASDIRKAGGAALACRADVLSKPSLEALAEKVVAEFGPVDILVNAAGGAAKNATTSPTLSFFELPEDAVRGVFDLNWLGTFLPCQVFGRVLQGRGQGAILNISSWGALHPLTRSVAYSAAKAAVSNFTQWLAVHLAQTYGPGIRVNALAPGFIVTEQNRFLLLDAATGELTERGRRIVAQTPFGRLGRPEDVVGPALWLLSDAAAFVHGSVVLVDGGMSAWGGV